MPSKTLLDDVDVAKIVEDTMDPGVLNNLLRKGAQCSSDGRKVVRAIFTSPAFSSWLILPEFRGPLLTASYLVVGLLLGIPRHQAQLTDFTRLKNFTQEKIDAVLAQMLTIEGRENLFRLYPDFRMAGTR